MLLSTPVAKNVILFDESAAAALQRQKQYDGRAVFWSAPHLYPLAVQDREVGPSYSQGTAEAAASPAHINIHAV